MTKYRKDALSIPNILTYIRVVLIPLFVYLYLWRRAYVAAAVVVAVSGVTDMLDGFIARTYDMITELGKILDPVADKMTQAALILCLLSRYPLMWILIGIFVVKEGVMAIAGILSIREGRPRLKGAMWFGKVSTIVQFIVMTALFAFPDMPTAMANSLIVLCAPFMLLAFFLYMREYRRINRGQ